MRQFRVSAALSSSVGLPQIFYRAISPALHRIIKPGRMKGSTLNLLALFMSATTFDAIIIGSGQAGNPLATALAEAGRHVALIEENRLGGSCINYGCSPTKTLLATAERLHQLRTAATVAAPETPGAAQLKVDLAAAVERKDAIIGKMRKGIRAVSYTHLTLPTN